MKALFSSPVIIFCNSVLALAARPCTLCWIHNLNLVDLNCASVRDYQWTISINSIPEKSAKLFFIILLVPTLNGYVVIKSLSINSTRPYFLATLTRGHFINDDVTVVLLRCYFLHVFLFSTNLLWSN